MMSMPARLRLVPLLGALCTGFVLAAASPAAVWAQDQAALSKVTDLNKKALEAYDNLEPEEARKLLMQALEVCAAAGLNSHPLKARTHVHLGVVLIGGFKQRDLAVKQFKRAFDIQPEIKLTKSLVNPETQSAFDEAKTSGSGAEPAVAEPKKEEPKAEEPKKEEPKEEPRKEPATEAAGDDSPPARFKGVFHKPISDARPNEPIVVKAAVASDLDFTKVIVAYRPEGASDYLQRPMQKDDKGWYVARIPEVATQGGLVSYYVEARAKGDKTVAANGSAAEPHVVTLAAGAPVAAGEPASGGDATVGTRASGDSEEPGGSRADAGDSKSKIWFGLSVGVGYGWFKGPAEVNLKDAQGNSTDGSGMAASNLLHLQPEISYAISPRLTVGLMGRIQIVTGATQVYDMEGCTKPGQNGICAPAKGAIAVMGKGTYFLNEGGRFRPFVSGAFGYGEIRHLVKIQGDLKGCGGGFDTTGPCTDTVLGGPVLLGPGAGFTYALAEGAALVASANLLVGVPKATANLDLNAGFAFGL